MLSFLKITSVFEKALQPREHCHLLPQRESKKGCAGAGRRYRPWTRKEAGEREDKDAGGPDLTECQRPGPASVFLRSHSWPSELYMATDLGAHLLSLG